MVLARKCAGARIAESEPAQRSQPQDDYWDRLYEIVTSECGNNRLPRDEPACRSNGDVLWAARVQS